ncbi:MAG: peptidoglycan editing factor PgeF [Methylophilaceae bacterium]
MTEGGLIKSFIIPDWPAPANVRAIQTTRLGGFSSAPYDSLNLGDHVKDNPIIVAKNRQLLNPYMPSEPVWLNQVHGIRVIDAALSSCLESADAAYTAKPKTVCVTMTADCLPVLLCDQAGTVVAAVHAGWRSLCDGVIEATVETMQTQKFPQDTQIMAWLGPAIGPQAFEVGGEVRAQFIEKDMQAESAFIKSGDKWLCDLYKIVQQRLTKLGVKQIYGGGFCTYSDKARFFSFRRDGDTGRMGTFIWLT